MKKMTNFYSRAVQGNVIFSLSTASNFFSILAVAEQPPQSYMTELKMYSTNIKSQVGGYVKLVCFVKSSLPVTFQWKYNGGLLEETSDTLIIQNAQTSHSGIYTCTMSNEMGMDSMQYTLTVESEWFLKKCKFNFPHSKRLRFLRHLIFKSQEFAPFLLTNYLN